VTVARRLASGFLANGMGQIWLILIQLVTVPVLSIKWGAAGYGTWLMISTVPAYIALSNFGFGTVAGIDMTRNYALGDRDKVLSSFQSVWLFISAILVSALVLTASLWWLRAPLLALLPSVKIKADVLDAACLLIVYAVAILEMNFVSAGYQCSGRYAQGTFLFDLAYPLEASVLVAACLLDGRMSVAALSITVVRIVALVAYYVRLLRVEPWMRLGWSHASLATIRRLAHPAIASLSMTVSATLSLEGLILSLGLFVSPAATAVFATTRMVTRFPLQFVRLASRATLPEMAAAFSTSNKPRTANLVTFNLIFTAAVAAPATILLIVFGPRIVDVLSHHRLRSSVLLFLGLSLTSLFQSTWNTVGQFLFAINRQQKFAYYYLALSALVVLSPLFVGHAATSTKVAMVWAFSEGAMCLIVYRCWWTETDLNLSDLMKSCQQLIGEGTLLVRRVAGR
jgi:O-antigen/teichoic acid export membrane protein